MPEDLDQSIPDVFLNEGSLAPDFALPDEEGRLVRLSDFRGKKLLLYFYPKDDSSTCTLEAANFRDELSEFEKQSVQIVGVSIDSVASHRSFKTKNGLNFPLLSDADHHVVRTYGVWKESVVHGRTFRSTERTTFVIDADGRIIKIFRKVSVDGHIQELFDALK